MFYSVLCIIYIGLFCLLVCANSTEYPQVYCKTTKGNILIEVYPEWAPLGAKRFLELIVDGFYTDIALFRCVNRFLTQFGISDKPEKKHWHNKVILDDPNLNKGIMKHYVSFAGGGKNTRSTQIFIAFEDLDFLGKESWEVPFGKVVEGEAVLKALFKGYGDIPPFGKGPDQTKLHNRGNNYIRNEFPLLDFVESCQVVDLENDILQEVLYRTGVLATEPRQSKRDQAQLEDTQRHHTDAGNIRHELEIKKAMLSSNTKPVVVSQNVRSSEEESTSISASEYEMLFKEALQAAEVLPYREVILQAVKDGNTYYSDLNSQYLVIDMSKDYQLRLHVITSGFIIVLGVLSCLLWVRNYIYQPNSKKIQLHISNILSGNKGGIVSGNSKIGDKYEDEHSNIKTV